MAVIATVFVWQPADRDHGAVAQSEFRIAAGDARFGQGLRRAAWVVDGRTGERLGEPHRCRWVPAHADVGLVITAANGCAAEFFIDPDRTRLTRFELDPWMSIDAIVSRDGRRAGVASSRLRFEAAAGAGE